MDLLSGLGGLISHLASSLFSNPASQQIQSEQQTNPVFQASDFSSPSPQPSAQMTQAPTNNSSPASMFGNLISTLGNDFSSGVKAVGNDLNQGFDSLENNVFKPVATNVQDMMDSSGLSSALKQYSNLPLFSVGVGPFGAAPQGSPTIGQADQFLANTTKDIAQAVPQTALSIGENVFGGENPQTFTPTTDLEKTILGNNPVTPMTEQIQQLSQKGQQFGLPSGVATPLAALGVGGMDVLNLTPAGDLLKVGEHAAEEGGADIIKQVLGDNASPAAQAALEAYQQSGKAEDAINAFKDTLGNPNLPDAVVQSKVQPLLDSFDQAKQDAQTATEAGNGAIQQDSGTQLPAENPTDATIQENPVTGAADQTNPTGLEPPNPEQPLTTEQAPTDTTKIFGTAQEPQAIDQAAIDAYSKSGNVDDAVQAIKDTMGTDAANVPEEEIQAHAQQLADMADSLKYDGKTAEEVAADHGATSEGDNGGKGASGDGTTTPPTEDKYAFNINKDRMNLTDEGKAALEKTVEDIKPDLQEAKGTTLSNADVIKGAQTSELLQKVVTKDDTQAFLEKLTAVRNAVAAGSEGKGLTQDFIDNLKVLSSYAADTGRRLQAFNIQADATLGDVKTGIVKKLIDLGHSTDEILRKAEGVDWNNKNEVAALWREFEKPSFKDLLDEYRYINLLSSPHTHIKKGFSELLQTVGLNPITKGVSGIVDTIAHTLTGKEQTHFISEVPAYFKGMAGNWGEALDSAWSALKGESSLGALNEKFMPSMGKGSGMIKVPFTQLGIPGTDKLTQGLATYNKYGRYITNALEAGSQFFRVLTEGGEKAALMDKYANMGKDVSEEQIAKEALDKSKYWLFRNEIDPTNKTGQGVVSANIDSLTKGVYALRQYKPVAWMIPFLHIPMNIFKMGLEYTPLGAVNMIGNADKVEAFSKAMIGSMVMGGSALAAQAGDATWAAPTDPKNKELFYASGRVPYALKVGNTWVSYANLGVLGYPMALAAAIRYYTTQDPHAMNEDTLTKIQNSIQGIAGFFSNESYVKGIGDMVKGLSGDTQAAKQMVANFPQQLVPLAQLLAWTNRIIDPVVRKAANPIESLESNIPGLSQFVAPQPNPAGQPEKRSLPLVNAFSPLGVGQVTQPFEDQFKASQTLSGYNIMDKAQSTLNKDTATKLFQAMDAAPNQQAADQIMAQYKSQGLLTPSVMKEFGTIVKSGGKTAAVSVDSGEDQQLLAAPAQARARYMFDTLKGMNSDQQDAWIKDKIEKGIINSKVMDYYVQLSQNGGNKLIPKPQK